MKQQQVKKSKRRGTIKLSQSKGPPQGLFLPQTNILTIGDGDLSFSLSVSNWLKYISPTSKANFIASTYDSEQQLCTFYSKSTMLHTLSELKKNNVKVFHGIDVLKLQQCKQLYELKYDRIVWNFPHAGFPQKSHGPGFEWEDESHEKHTSLIQYFFKYCIELLSQQGLVIMSHKTIPPFSLWNIPKIAQGQGYQLRETHKFDIDDYPGYQTRRGAGKHGGKTFPMDDAVTYVFEYVHKNKQI